MMEDNGRGEENNEEITVTGVANDGEAAEEQEGSSDNRYQLIPKRSSSQRRSAQKIEQYDRKPSRSRSRSRSKPPRRGQRRSANAFFNFMQDFKQDHDRLKSKDLFRLGGQRWRRMSSAEKMPYVEVAKLAKQQTQQDNKNGQQNKTNGSDASKKKPENQKRKKYKERKRSRSKTDDSDVDSYSASSGTGATSEDISDLSS